MIRLTLVGLQATKRDIQAALTKELKLLTDEVYTEVRANTPVDTGRARSGWRKTVQPTRGEITNDVPYVPVLDRGRHMTSRGIRGSNQAPKGIIGPSLDNIKKRN